MSWHRQPCIAVQPAAPPERSVDGGIFLEGATLGLDPTVPRACLDGSWQRLRLGFEEHRKHLTAGYPGVASNIALASVLAGWYVDGKQTSKQSRDV